MPAIRDITFTGAMVRAERANLKDVTRRILDPQPSPNCDSLILMEDGGWCEQWGDTIRAETNHLCRYGKPGDRLRVKESAWMWCEKRPNGRTERGNPKHLYVPMRNAQVFYAAEHTKKPDLDVVSPVTGNPWGWRFKIGRYLPHWAVRTVLEVTTIRSERLQDITAEQAIAEGITSAEGFPEHWTNYLFETAHPRSDVPITDEQHRIRGYRDPIRSFQSLFTKINGPGIWEANPQVWVVGFKRLKAV